MTVRGRGKGTLRHNYSYAVGDKPALVTRRRAALAKRCGFDPTSFIILRQTHSATVHVIDDTPLLSPETEGDALITSQDDILLGVTIADCVPILLFDRKQRVVAAIHSGWRGTEKKIATATIARMCEEYGSDPTDIRAWVGPSAGGCCYEVGADVADRFDKKYHRPIDNEKFLLDTRRVIVGDLIASGLPSTSIDLAIRCTICDPTLHSWRRDAVGSGRMIAVIGMRSADRSG